MALLQNMGCAILVLFLFAVFCIMLFIATALPIEMIKQLKEMSRNGKNKS